LECAWASAGGSTGGGAVDLSHAALTRFAEKVTAVADAKAGRITQAINQGRPRSFSQTSALLFLRSKSAAQAPILSFLFYP
jgi:hypothetical protein